MPPQRELLRQILKGRLRPEQEVGTEAPPYIYRYTPARHLYICLFNTIEYPTSVIYTLFLSSSIETKISSFGCCEVMKCLSASVKISATGPSACRAWQCG